MFDRFPVLGPNSYDSHLVFNQVWNWARELPQSPVKDILRSQLFGNKMVRDGVDRTTSAVVQSGQATVNAIGSSTGVLQSTLNSGFDKVALASLGGAALTSATIAVSAALILHRMKEISVGIDRLGSAFTEGMSLVVSKIDILNDSFSTVKDELRAIHQTLKSPTLTQAAEWRDIGLTRMADTLWPEARKAFEKAISLDETDAISHLMLGQIYLDGVTPDTNLCDSDKAYAHFLHAQKYSSASKGRVSHYNGVQIDSMVLAAIACLACANREFNKKHRTKEYDQWLTRALGLVDGVLTLDKNHRQAGFLKSKIHMLEGNSSRTREAINTLLELHPSAFFDMARDKDFTHFSELGKDLFAEKAPWFAELVSKRLIKARTLVDTIINSGSALREDVRQWFQEAKGKVEFNYGVKPTLGILLDEPFLHIDRINLVIHECEVTIQELKDAALNLGTKLVGRMESIPCIRGIHLLVPGFSRDSIERLVADLRSQNDLLEIDSQVIKSINEAERQVERAESLGQLIPDLRSKAHESHNKMEITYMFGAIFITFGLVMLFASVPAVVAGTVIGLGILYILNGRRIMLTSLKLLATDSITKLISKGYEDESAELIVKNVMDTNKPFST